MNKLVIFSFAFLLSTCLCYAQYDWKEPPLDGIYKIRDVSIKYIAPKGWKAKDLTYMLPPGFGFMPPEQGMVVLTITAHCDAASGDNFDRDLYLEGIKRLSKGQFINFAGVKAVSYIDTSRISKTKTIEFVRGKNIFMISFLAEKNFDKWLPIVDKSLKTFEFK